MNRAAESELATDAAPQVYAALEPETILQALASAGFHGDGGLQTLNSFENRVYAFRDDHKNRFVAKFYRPGRWSRAQIQEEQDFLFYLHERELPVLLPLRHADNRCVFEHENFLFTVSPQRGGRALDGQDPVQLEILGRSIGRLHAAAEHFPFRFRERLEVEHYAGRARLATLASAQLPAAYAERYAQLSQHLLTLCQNKIAAFSGLEYISCHGDMHAGNILWTGSEVLMVDFDDARTAPAIQDLWMLASDNAARDILVDAYEDFMEFDWRQWQLAEAMRSLRMVQYTGWLAARWSDPTFPRHFPWFATAKYFEEQIVALQQQIDLLED